MARVSDTAGIVSDPANGAPADAAWPGSGPGGIIAILKAIWAKVGLQVGGSDVSAANPLFARVGVVDSTGAVIYPDSYATSATTRDTAGNLLTMTITDGTTSWVQTITRDASGNLSAMSKWVRQ